MQITMKNFFLTLLLTILIVSSHNSLAQARKYNIAVVDMQLLASESKAAKNIKAQIQEMQSKYQEEINKKEKVMLKKEKSLKSEYSLLSKEALLEKQKEFQQELVSIQKEVSSKKKELSKKLKESLSTLQKKVISITEQIAKDKDISLVIPTSQVMYYKEKETLNITHKVLNKLNKELPKIKISYTN